MEKKVFSQNGEDGILQGLRERLNRPNDSFIEIGCSDGAENNSRNLINTGMNGTGVDISWEKLTRYLKAVSISGSVKQITLKCMRVTSRNAKEILGWEGLDPDIFSLDIDSYDYFIADKLLRLGFRPSIVCLETNSFLGTEPITVDYISSFSRYRLQPDFGLYFGASPNAWRSLWKKYGYKSLGMDSSGTNIFFILPERMANPTEQIDEPSDVHQSMFVNKYKKSGDELSQILLGSGNLKFYNVETPHYEARYQKVCGATNVYLGESSSFVTTFVKKTYEEVAHKLIESFDKHWPPHYELIALGENCSVRRPSIRVLTEDLERVSDGLTEFKARHRFNPGANGRFGSKYFYVFDSVKWAHKVFAVEAASKLTDAELLIYIDSDIITFNNVPNDFLSTLIPDGVDIAYMPRKTMYSECSFVIYRQRNPMVRKFIHDHAHAYRTDSVFQLPGWTDCHIFDALVKVHTQNKTLTFWDINSGVPSSTHPFINGPLGQYMDHMKGARKDAGKSYTSDLVVERQESYWNKPKVTKDEQ